MPIRFHVNPETGQPHILDHGVTEDEVEEVLQTATDNLRSREGSRIATGPTFAGRILRVIYARRHPADETFVITAYELRGSPLASYRRRMRRRGR